MTCIECGEEIDYRYVEERNEKMRTRRMCFTDTFWADLHERTQSERRPSIITPDYGHFIPGTGDASSPSSSRGFGGSRVLIKFDLGKEIESVDLWSQGTIPEHWRDRFEPNAVLEWQ